jgi:hypothetical protein
MRFYRLNKVHKLRFPNQTEPFPTIKELRELYKSNNGILSSLQMHYRRMGEGALGPHQAACLGRLHILKNLRFLRDVCNLTRQRPPTIFQRMVYNSQCSEDLPRISYNNRKSNKLLQFLLFVIQIFYELRTF